MKIFTSFTPKYKTLYYKFPLKCESYKLFLKLCNTFPLRLFNLCIDYLSSVKKNGHIFFVCTEGVLIKIRYA